MDNVVKTADGKYVSSQFLIGMVLHQKCEKGKYFSGKSQFLLGMVLPYRGLPYIT